MTDRMRGRWGGTYMHVSITSKLRTCRGEGVQRGVRWEQSAASCIMDRFTPRAVHCIDNRFTPSACVAPP
jgi:hypothetical protein